MRPDQFNDFKADIKAGLSEDLLSELYDLPLAEVRKGKKYLNRTWLECLISGFKQFLRKIVFEFQMKFRMLRIRQLSRQVNKNDK